MIFLSTHQATNLCFRAVKKTEGVCRAEYNPDVGSTECGTFFTAGPTCLLRPIRQHTPDGTELTSPDTAVEQFQSALITNEFQNREQVISSSLISDKHTFLDNNKLDSVLQQPLKYEQVVNSHYNINIKCLVKSGTPFCFSA